MKWFKKSTKEIKNEGADRCQEFLKYFKQGQRINYLGTILLVERVQTHRLSGIIGQISWPEIVCAYINTFNEIKNIKFEYDDLPALLAENPQILKQEEYINLKIDI